MVWRTLKMPSLVSGRAGRLDPVHRPPPSTTAQRCSPGTSLVTSSPAALPGKASTGRSKGGTGKIPAVTLDVLVSKSTYLTLKRSVNPRWQDTEQGKRHTEQGKRHRPGQRTQTRAKDTQSRAKDTDQGKRYTDEGKRHTDQGKRYTDQGKRHTDQGKRQP